MKTTKEKPQDVPAIDWAKFSLQSDPAYAAAVAAREKLARREMELKAAIADFETRSRLAPVVSPRKRAAENMLNMAEGGTAVLIGDDDRLDETQHLKNVAELNTLEDAMRMAREKVQATQVRASYAIRKRLTPARAVIVENMRAAVVALLKTFDEERDFQNELERREFVGQGGGGAPWLVFSLRHQLEHRLKTWIEEHAKTNGFLCEKV